MKRRTSKTPTVKAQQSVRKNSRDLDFLLEMSQALVSTLDMATVLQTTVDKTTKRLEMDSGAIYLVEGEQLRLGATTPALLADVPEAFRQTTLRAHPHVHRSIASGSPVVVSDTATETFTQEELQIVKARGVRSLLYVPLLIENRAVGSLIVGTVNRIRTFSTYEIDLLRTISNQAALVIENARLYEDANKHTVDLERQISERKQAESLLRLQSAALDAAANAIVITNRDGSIQWHNPAFADLTGYTAAESNGKNPRELIRSGVHDKAFFKNLWETILSGKVWRGEITNRRKDGTLYTEEQSITPLLNERGEIGHFIAIKEDVTERLQAEKLQKTVYDVARASTSATTLDELYAAIHRILSQALDASNLYIALFDSASDMISFPYFVDQFDTPPPPRKAGRGLTEYVLRTGRSLLCDEMLAEELARRGEAEVVGAPSPIWLGVPLKVDGKTIGVLAVQHYSNPHAYGGREQQVLEFVSSEVAHAIDRKRAEQDIEHSLSLLAASLESTADGILVVDNAGKIVRFNQRFSRMWRIPDAILATRDDDQALGFVLAQLKDPQGFLSKVRELYAQPEAESHDVLDFKDGRTFERFSIPQRIGSAVVGRVWSFRDVSENRKLQRQFIQSQKMESLGTLASGIAHDFNNILTIIIGHASQLEHHPGDRSTIMRNVDAIAKASRRGTALVRQMLTFARKTEILIESVALNDVVNEIVKLLQETFPRTVTVVTDLEQDLVSIEADATQVHQVLLNLCVNGRDAMPGGGVLTISTHRESGESLRKQNPTASAEEYVVLSVSDTGIGMNAETQNRIFEPFFSTKEYGKGTGLGLSLVFGIMETHKGFVTVQSEVGKGTTFQCCFPVPGATIGPRVLEGRSEEDMHGGTETLLVVEDEDELRELYALSLERKGYTVLAAGDGEEGLEVYRQNQSKIQLVLSDVGLPKLSGDELYRRLKALNPQLPVILASGYVEPRMKARLLAEGVREVIEKPYNPGEVLRIIRRVLDTEGLAH